MTDPSSRRSAVLLLSLGLLLAGCARAPGHASPLPAPAHRTDVGTVTGLVRTYGGPMLGSGEAAQGVLNGDREVVVRLHDRVVLTSRTSGAGRFVIQLPSGTYTLDACGGDAGSGQTVVVRTGVTTVGDLACQVP